MAMTSSVIYEGGLRTTCVHLRSGSAFETDAPVDNQGKGERFSPTDLLATSLASCMLTTMAIRARELEEAIRQIKIDTEKIMKAEPRRVSGIILTFHYPSGFSISEEQRAKLEEIAWTCPVKESIHPDIELDVKFNWPDPPVAQGGA
jgi:putative redox protein